MKNIFLEAKRVYLRPLEEKDIEGNYISWLNDAEVNMYNSHHVYPYSLEEGRAYIKKSQKDKGNLVLAIVTKRGNAHIGNISLQRIDYVSRSSEFAILLGEKKYWNKGYSKEASKLLLAHGFNALGLLRIHCGISSKNLSMQKLALSLGMTLEGRRRKALFKGGQFIDILEYGILVSEFESK